jgi:cold shock CspA family protein
MTTEASGPLLTPVRSSAASAGSFPARVAACRRGFENNMNATAEQHDGTIDRINIDRGFGFIRIPDMPDVFFHFSELTGELTFDETLIERRIRCLVHPGNRGLVARQIQPAD